MKTVFLAGGNGFIGKNIRAALDRVYDISAPRRQTLDLTDAKSVRHYFSEKSFDCILNGANVGGLRTSKDSENNAFEKNMRAFLNLYGSINRKTKFIQMGSGAEYGKHRPIDNVREDAFGEYLPEDAYGLHKYVASEMLEKGHFHKSVNLRIFAVYGPHENYHVRFISNAIIKTLLNKPIVINQDVLFDYLYIDDFVKIVEAFIENEAAYHAYNIGFGKALQLSEIAVVIRDVLGAKNDIRVKNKTLNNAYTCDNTRLREFLGAHFEWTPLESGVGKLAKWYESNMASINEACVV